jgi:hypothetical protein
MRCTLARAQASGACTASGTDPLLISSSDARAAILVTGLHEGYYVYFAPRPFPARELEEAGG